MGIAPAGHVAAGCRHRNVAVTGDQAGQKLDLRVQNRRALRLRKALHLVVGKADVVLEFGRHFLGRLRPLGGRHHDLTLPLIQAARVVGGLRLAASLDLVEHRLHGRANVGLAGRRRLRCAFEIFDGHEFPFRQRASATPTSTAPE